MTLIGPERAVSCPCGIGERFSCREHVDTPSVPAQPPPQRAFAVVEVGPTQFKVAVDDMIVTERLRGADVNQTVALNRVLMLGDQASTSCNPHNHERQICCM